MNNLVLRAREIAIEAHHDQWYGDGIPYWHHLEAAHDVLVEFGVTDPEVLAAAWLHDILEDCEYTSPMSLLDDGVTPYTLAIVDAVTNPPNMCRAQRHQIVYPRIARMQDAVMVKLADRISNVRACVKTGDSRGKMYAKEHDEFRRALKVNGGGNFAMWSALDECIREIRA